VNNAADDIEQQRQWVQLWKNVTGPALERIHDRELLDMSEDRAREISAMLLDVPEDYPLRQESGLVEQQFWFQKAWKK